MASDDQGTQGFTLVRWLSLDGRIGRQTYWLHYTVPIAVTNMVAGFVDIATGSAAVGLTVGIATIWPGLAAVVKRFHDLNRSTMFAIAFFFGAAALEALGEANVVNSPIALAAFLPLIVAGLYFLVRLGFVRGTQGPNRFGPDPVG